MLPVLHLIYAIGVIPILLAFYAAAIKGLVNDLTQAKPDEAIMGLHWYLVYVCTGLMFWATYGAFGRIRGMLVRGAIAFMILHTAGTLVLLSGGPMFTNLGYDSITLAVIIYFRARKKRPTESARDLRIPLVRQDNRSTDR